MVLVAAVVAAVLAGCSSYRVVKSDVVLPASAGDSGPLPLRVGVKVVGQSLSGGFGDMGPALASRISNARLFKSVIHPVKPDDRPDLLIEVNFSGKHTGDSSSFAKGFFTWILLLLPAPAVEYEDHYISTAAVNITKDGRSLKSYSAGADVIVESKLMTSDADIQREGVAAATSNLMDRIIAQLYNDRSYFAGLRAGSQ
jgi:hypothetical protein